jgi:hypothetical protein
MKRSSNPWSRAAWAALVVCFIAFGAFAQTQSGNIYGTVESKDGAVLPGVTVTLTGVGAPQTTVSDGQGRFRFLNLSPGTYDLRGELSGYGTAARSGVRVSVGSNADITIALNPSLAETITVTAEAPLLDIRKTGTGATVTKVELEQIPTSRDPWTVLQQAPGVQVDRMNVGGNQSGQQSVYLGKGSGSRENTWNVDGVNITDNGATGSSPTYYDFDSFEEMQIATGGSDPRIQTPGVQLNMVTKRGTNDFRGSGRYFYTPGSYQAEASVPDEASSYLSATNEINYVRDYGIEIGGPVWRDKVWFWGARADNKISNFSSTLVGGTASPDNIVLRNKNAKVNAQLFSSNSAVGFYNFGDKVRNARSLSTTRPFETSWRQTGPGEIFKLEDTQIVGSTFYLTAMWSKVTGGFALVPNGGVGPDTPNVYRDIDSVWHNSFSFYDTVRPQKQYRADASKFVDIGTMNHELKFGFGYRNTPVSSSSGFPGSTQGYVRDRTPGACVGRGLEAGCVTVNLYRDANKSYDTEYRDLYIGDTILLGNLTIQAGARYDMQNSKNTASFSSANPLLATPLTLPNDEGNPATAFLPALQFPGDSRELEWNSISPRIGVTWALGAEKQTLVRAGYNRYVSQIGATASLGSPFTYYSYFILGGYDTNHDHVAQRSELVNYLGSGYVDPSNPGALVGPTRLDYGMNPPKTDEFILGFERQLLADFSVGVNFSHRSYSDLLETRNEKTQGGNDFYTSADYQLLFDEEGHQVFGGGTIVADDGTVIRTPEEPVYELKSGVARPVYAVVRNRPDYKQTYNGIELMATKRLSNRWMMRANVAWNDWKEDSGPDSFADPTRRLLTTGGCVGNCNGQVIERSAGSGAFGNVFINSQWSANVTGLYQLPWDISIGASFAARQGYPALYRDEVSTNANSSGFSDVILHEIGDSRFDNVYEFDLRLAKEIRYQGVGLTLSADLFNVPNQRTVLQRETLVAFDKGYSGNGDQITELQSPRVWRLGARFSF